MSSLLEQLAQLDQRVAEGHQRAIELEGEAKQAKTDLERVSGLLTEAYAADDAAAQAKLGKAKEKAQARADEPWSEKIAGAKLAARRLEVERDTWRHEHVAGLLDEVEPEAQEAAEALQNALEAVERARRGWHAVAHRVSGMVTHLPGQPPAMPMFDGVDSAIRTMRRDIGQVPLPMPRGRQTISIVPTSDPDPAVREAARAKAGR